MTETNPAFLITDNHQGGKTEPAATLDHLGDSIDVYQLVDKLAVAAVSEVITCHRDLAFPKNSSRLRARHPPTP